MKYNELIKDFEKIRSYMREFYIYGFKSRRQFGKKSGRTYDDERRRIQSYLGELLKCGDTSEGKNYYISLDGRGVSHNPLYRAFKSKAFTDKDITLHFYLLDILSDGIEYTAQMLCEIITEDYYQFFVDVNDDISSDTFCDEKTIRNKLNEYVKLGIITARKEGRGATYYRLQEDGLDLEGYRDAIRFFTEINPLGVVGSYIEDRIGPDDEYLAFKDHYIMNAYDTEILGKVLQCIREKREMSVTTIGVKETENTHRVVPMKLYMSTQGGRNYAMCMDRDRWGRFVLKSIRIDRVIRVELLDVCEQYDSAKEQFEKIASHMWGVSFGNQDDYKHIEIDIRVEPGEEYIVRRVNREMRCGTISKAGDNLYRFSADVCNCTELKPWIRSFCSRVAGIRCDEEKVIVELKEELAEMAEMYEVER